MNPKSARKQKTIAYLEKTGIYIYLPGKETVLSLSFSMEVVRSGDVLDKAKFSTLVQNFLSANGISSYSITLLVAQNLLFTKDILHDVKQSTSPQSMVSPHAQPAAPQNTAQSPAQPSQNGSHASQPVKKEPTLNASELAAQHEMEKKETQSFVEKVPFDLVFYKTMNIPNGIRVFATSGDLLKALQQALSINNNAIEGGIPLLVFSDVSLQNGFTADIARQLLQKVDTMRQYNLFDTPQPEQQSTDERPLPLNIPLKRSKNLRLYLMIAVFAVLLFILVLVYFMTNASDTSTTKKITPTPFANQPTIAVSPSVPVSSQSAVFSQSTKVHIIATPLTATRVPLLQKEIESLGIRQISSESTASSSSATVQFAPSIPANAQDAILTRVRKYIPQVVTEEVMNAPYDVVISF